MDAPDRPKLGLQIIYVMLLKSPEYRQVSYRIWGFYYSEICTIIIKKTDS